MRSARHLIRMDDEREFKLKVSEKLIFILNRVDDIDKAEVFGNLFKVYVEGAYNVTVFVGWRRSLIKCTCTICRHM